MLNQPILQLKILVLIREGEKKWRQQVKFEQLIWVQPSLVPLLLCYEL